MGEDLTFNLDGLISKKVPSHYICCIGLQNNMMNEYRGSRVRLHGFRLWLCDLGYKSEFLFVSVSC